MARRRGKGGRFVKRKVSRSSSKRRVSQPKRRRARRTMRAFRSRQNRSIWPKETSKWIRGGRIIDVITSSVQRAFHPNAGATTGQDKVDRVKYDVLGLAPDGSFELGRAMPHAGGVATGLIRDKLRSKLGVYRGVAKGKLLSMAMAVNPEIMATSVVDPLEDFHDWNAQRVMADRGYDLSTGGWGLSDDRFKKSIITDAVLWGAQKVAESTGMNKALSEATDGMLKL